MFEGRKTGEELMDSKFIISRALLGFSLSDGGSASVKTCLLCHSPERGSASLKTCSLGDYIFYFGGRVRLVKNVFLSCHHSNYGFTDHCFDFVIGREGPPR